MDKQVMQWADEIAEFIRRRGVAYVVFEDGHPKSTATELVFDRLQRRGAIPVCVYNASAQHHWICEDLVFCRNISLNKIMRQPEWAAA